jgi:hypothetical protein
MWTGAGYLAGCPTVIFVFYDLDRVRLAESTRPRPGDRAVLLPGCSCAILSMTTIWVLDASFPILAGSGPGTVDVPDTD